MDYHLFKSAVNRYLLRHVGGEQRPVFYDVPTSFPALDRLTRACPAIRAECQRLLDDRRQLPRYHDVDPGEAKISAASERRWNVFVLDILGHKPHRNRACCPTTCGLLDQIPGLIQAFFSVLEPGKSIPAHEGPYVGYLRYHLALRVPRHEPPRLRVKGQEYQWREGEAVLFDDSWTHEVINHSSEIRAVLVVDVLRPLPLLPSLVNRFVTNVVARHTYGRQVARRIDSFSRDLMDPGASSSATLKRAA